MTQVKLQSFISMDKATYIVRSVIQRSPERHAHLVQRLKLDHLVMQWSCAESITQYTQWSRRV